jgi:ankyrin repeat protein
MTANAATTITGKSGQISGRLIAATAACLIVAIGVPWCQSRFGSYDPLTGNRVCGDPPSEIHVWAFNNHTRSSAETISLQKWIARNPRRINTQYGAFCQTPLHLASRFAREDLADTLIAAGADVKASDRLGETALHAAANGLSNQSNVARIEVARLLLAAGADVNARARNGFTPLRTATTHDAGNAKMAALLRSYGAVE